MKFKFVVFFAFFIVFSAQSQNVIWYTDAHKAVAESNKVKKPLLVFFTGSDWCGWCKRLQNEVFNTADFKSWANKNVVLLEIDFPRINKQPQNISNQNQQLQQAFGIQGFPTVWFVTSTVTDTKTHFSPIGKTGYVAGGASEWLSEANSILKMK